MLVDVGALEEYVDGESVFRVVTVGEREYGILRWHGEFYAVRNQCPHRGGHICGFVRPHATVDPATSRVALDLERPILVCAWHHWEFDLRSGQALCDPAVRAKTIPIVLSDDDRVLIDLPGSSV